MTPMWAWLWLACAWGSDRLIRVWTEDDGLPVRKVLALAQDDDGWLYVGTAAGVARFDGRSFVPVAPDAVREQVQALAIGPGHRLVVAERYGPVTDLSDPAHPVRLSGPAGPFEAARDVAIDATGAVWVLDADQGLLRASGGAWDAPLADRLAPDEVVLGVATHAGAALLFTSQGVWPVDGGTVGARIDAVEPADALVPGGGDAVVIGYEGEIAVGHPGAWTRLDVGMHTRRLVSRAGTVWIACDSGLLGLRDGRLADEVTLSRRLGGANELLVDREGSLWLASFQGLLQLPEPDTLTLTEDDGLPSDLTDVVSPWGDGAWVATRAGLAWVAPSGRAWRARLATDLGKPMDVCPGSDGVAWTAGFTGASSRKLVDAVAAALTVDGGETRYAIGATDGSATCATDASGQVWLATESAVWRADVTGPVRVADGPGGTDGAPKLEVDGDTLWWLAEGLACRLPVDGVGTAPWDCAQPDPTEDYTDAWTVGGDVWLATRRGGVVDLAGTKVEGLFGSDVIRGFTPSPRGGAWVWGQRTLARVVRGPGGPEVVERLGEWHGLIDGSPNDLAESPDGSVWLATLGGVTRIPATARAWPSQPVPVRVVGLSRDGLPLPPGPIALPPDGNRLEVDVAGLAFRDPAALRWRMVRDGVPVPLDGGRVRFLDLAAGRYDVAVQASADDGRTWSPAPAAVSFEVLRPWYRQPWALAAFALLLALAVYLVHRARVAVLVGLERQRARIALDLHDEIGSGLGGIGLLAGVLRDRDVAPDPLAARIAQTAEELGTSLTDIVWALRRGSESPEALIEHLEARGRALFADPGTKLTVVRPERWPVASLSLSVRRNLQAIALEALHNAAKHAHASAVELGMQPAGREWRLWVADDGRGVDAGGPARPGGGSGLDGMRHRAENLGGRLHVDSGPTGTTITVWFQPGAEDRRVDR